MGDRGVGYRGRGCPLTMLLPRLRGRRTVILGAISAVLLVDRQQLFRNRFGGRVGLDEATTVFGYVFGKLSFRHGSRAYALKLIVNSRLLYVIEYSHYICFVDEPTYII